MHAAGKLGSAEVFKDLHGPGCFLWIASVEGDFIKAGLPRRRWILSKIRRFGGQKRSDEVFAPYGLYQRE